MQEFQNLYEVRKTVRFELKPSKITQLFLEKEKIYNNPTNILYKNKFENWFNYSKQVFEDNLKDSIEQIKNIFINLEKVQNLLWNLPFKEIYIDRKIYELIDKNYYIHSVKSKKIPSISSLSLIKRNLDWQWVNVIRNYYENNLISIQDIIISIENIWKKDNSFSKNEIKRILKKLSLEIIRVYNFLQYFDIENKDFNQNLKEYIEKILNLTEFIEEIKLYYFISENQSSWILLRRFWFNEKSLKRRQPKEIKDDLIKIKNEFDEKNEIKKDLEFKKQKLIEDFDLKTKQEKFPELLKQEKIKQIRENENKSNEDKEYIEKIDKNFIELKELRNNDKVLKDITKNLNDIKKQFWNLKVTINNLEKELENNLALTHYSKLIEKVIDWEKLYYLVLIPVNEKTILEKHIWKWNSKILEYNTLTFNALEKLALSYDGTMWIYWDKQEEKNKKTWIKKWIIDLYKDLKDWKKQEDFYKFKRYITNLIKTYNDVFWNICFDFYQLSQKNNLGDFIKEFNRQWYKISWKSIDFGILEELEQKNKLEFYQIYTKDFYKDPNFFDIDYSIKEQKEERQKRRKEKNVNGNKNLFCIYWEKFIKDIDALNSNVRLNSDCWFYVKLADENIALEDKWKSRKKRNKIIWTFHLSFNPNKTLWKGFDEKQNIEEFNKIYKSAIKNIENLTLVWLDRWEKELLTFCLIDKDLNCIKDKKWKYLIWDLNCINSKWQFVKNDDCLWKDWNWKIYNDLIWNFLPDFSHPENIVEWKKKFQQDNENALYYFKLNHDARFYLLEWEKQRFKVLNKDWKEIFLQDTDWNKVINYYFLFQTEVYKRHILNKTWDIKLEDIQELRWWYISNVIKQLNKWIIEYNWVLVLENLDKIQKDDRGNIYQTNKEKNQEKTFWSTVYQEIETLLNRKYNYFIYKNKDLWEFQLTPKIKNISDIKNLEKSWKDVNLGNLIFIDEYLTSKECPNCKNQLFRDKKWWDSVYHNEKNVLKNWCNFSTKNWWNNYWFDFIQSWDDLAAYNIAKKWLEYLKNLQ